MIALQPVTRGASVMEPTSAPLVAAGAVPLPSKKAAAASGGATPAGATLAKLSSDAFAALAEAQVDSADLFFHK